MKVACFRVLLWRLHDLLGVKHLEPHQHVVGLESVLLLFVGVQWPEWGPYLCHLWADLLPSLPPFVNGTVVAQLQEGSEQCKPFAQCLPESKSHQTVAGFRTMASWWKEGWMGCEKVGTHWAAVWNVHLKDAGQSFCEAQTETVTGVTNGRGGWIGGACLWDLQACWGEERRTVGIFTSSREYVCIRTERNLAETGWGMHPDQESDQQPFAGWQSTEPAKAESAFFKEVNLSPVLL